MKEQMIDMEINSIQILFDYNQWANERLLRKAARLSSANLTEPCWLSQGDVMGTLVHMLDAEWYWRNACQTGLAPGERLSKDMFPDMQALIERWKVEDLAAYRLCLFAVG